MSIKVMNLVWSHAPREVTQGKLLVLLAMADYCDDKGENIFPTMQTLGKKARLNESQARRAVAELIKLNLLERVNQGGWDETRKRNRPSEFRIIVETLEAAQRQELEDGVKETQTGGRKMRPGAPARPRWAKNAPTVGASQPQSSPINSANPSLEPSSNPSVENRPDADDVLRSALLEVGVKPTAATLRHYREQETRFGLATVLAGLERAAAHGKADVRAYVGKCIASAATGEQDPDAARRRQYIPAEWADIIHG